MELAGAGALLTARSLGGMFEQSAEVLVTGTLLVVGTAIFSLQTGGAAIVGSVVDAASGEPLGGAMVALSDLDRSTTTTLRGRYHLGNVPAGPQHLTARFLGYAPRTVHALVPNAGELEITIALTVVPAKLATVEVRPAIAVRGGEPRAADDLADRSMSIASIRNQPLLAEPDVLEAIGGGEVSSHPEAPSGVHLRGAAADQTAYLLDGFPVFSPYHAAGMFGAFNPDAVAEVEVWTSSTPPDVAAALGGAVNVMTIRPGERTRWQGSASATQARLTLDGPVVGGTAGYVVSVRNGFPGLLATARDPSHITGESGDRIATIDAAVGGGRLRMLFYDAANEISASAGSVTGEPAVRNAFEWESRTLGGEWRRPIGKMMVSGRVWTASGTSEAGWSSEPGALDLLGSARRDAGALASVEHVAGGSTTSVAIRLESSRTSIALARHAVWAPNVATPNREAVATSNRLATVFIRHRRRLAGAVSLQADGAIARMRGATFLSPGVTLRWAPSERFTLTSAYSRRHQFAQSLRNDESLVGTIFPAELFVAAGTGGVPVGRADHVALSARLNPARPLTLTAQAYARRSRGLLLAALGTGDPFTIREFARGAGSSHGASIEAAMSGARYAALASYGWQRTRVSTGGRSYVPHYAAAHRLDAGVVLFPTTTLSFRLGGTAIAGRASTPSHGPLEWESCNLLDLGCEFGGSPSTRPDETGTRTLPSYVRVDAGVRKHWHIRARGRDVTLAAFGTVTNIISRPNTLAYVIDDASGERQRIDMRPLAPLVVGLDWRF